MNAKEKIMIRTSAKLLLRQTKFYDKFSNMLLIYIEIYVNVLKYTGLFTLLLT